MEPFSIVCKSCAAKLKVTKASAVGQILACPKCGTMIEVVAPEGWIVPKPAEVSDSQFSNVDLSGAGSLGGDFDDIEHILGKPQSTTQTKNVKHSKKAASPVDGVPPPTRSQKRGSNRDQSNSPGQVTPRVDGPILPTDQWTGEDTRKRKRIVVTVVGVLGTLLLLAAISTAFIFNLSNPVDNVASNDQQPATDTIADGAANPVDPANDDATGGPLANLNRPNDPGDLAANDPTNHLLNPGRPANGPDWDGVGPAPIENNLANEVNPPKIPNNDRGPDQILANDPENRDPIENSKSNNTEPGPKVAGINLINPPPLPGVTQIPNQGDKLNSPFDAANANQEQQSPFAVEPPPPKPNTTIGIVEELENDLGELANLLEQRGTSISEFKDIASQINNQQPIGLPKYVVIPSKSLLNFELENRLEYPIGGLIYDSAPLIRVLRNIETISGIPISIDAHSIVLAGKDPNPLVTIKITETDVQGALDQILVPLGLSKQAYPLGISVGNFGSQALSKAEFELPEIPDIKADDRKRFVATIREFVEPESWVREESPATIELVDNTIVVNCSIEMQAQIDVLISKLKSSFALIQDPSNTDALASTRSRWKSISPLLAKDPVLTHSTQSEIEPFLSKFLSKTDVSVLVDWPSVTSEGWTPQTMIPGNIQESTVLDVVLQLAQSMRLAILAVNDNTMVMTTFERSAKIVDLEVYPVSKILAGSLNENQMMRLVDNALGNKLQSKSVRYAYQPSCRCVIVLAPQTLQRQIEALLDRLDGI